VHSEAYDWISRYAMTDPVTVLDVGGRDINGSPRPLFPAADYTVLDVADGFGVDVVADAATWTPDCEYDVVLCAEVFEHTAVWPAICATAFRALRPGGRLVVTCAGPGRAAHSAVDGGPFLHPGEWYANVDPDALVKVLDDAGFVDIVVDQAGPDVRGAALKP
jgi:SAM-dependent methyltransferase